MATYNINDIEYEVPDESKIDLMKTFNRTRFDEPETLLNLYLHYGMLYGPQLIAPALEHFETLSDPDMPKNYIADFIAEFYERIETKLFIIKNQRFKLIKLKDKVSQEFSKEIITRNGLTIDEIDVMTGVEFEHFLCRLFNEDGYNATVTKASNDQGADLIIEKFGERTVVQAKRYISAVSNTAIQEVVAAKAIYRCQNAMVVTNSYFTKSAIMLAMSNKVTLYDREKLKEKLEDYNLNTSSDFEN